MISQPLADVRRLYAEAEFAIKRYERIALEDQIAAVNELRYAGHHILEAESEEDETKRLDHLTSARNHCRRAVQDAKDGHFASDGDSRAVCRAAARTGRESFLV